MTRCTTAERVSLATEAKSCWRRLLIVARTFVLIESVSDGFPVWNSGWVDRVDEAIKMAMLGNNHGNILPLKKGPVSLPSTEQKLGTTT